MKNITFFLIIYDICFETLLKYLRAKEEKKKIDFLSDEELKILKIYTQCYLKQYRDSAYTVS